MRIGNEGGGGEIQIIRLDGWVFHRTNYNFHPVDVFPQIYIIIIVFFFDY